MSNTLLQLYNSSIHHDSQNNRIYLMSLAVEHATKLIPELFELADHKKYTKIIAKVPKSQESLFVLSGFSQEASIPSFFSTNEDCLFMACYLHPTRRLVANQNTLNAVLDTAHQKTFTPKLPPLAPPYSIRQLEPTDTQHMSTLYQQVFETYPFPIFDTHYLKETMSSHVIYFGLFYYQQLIGIASCEMDPSTKSCEMTDFAILEAYRGHDYASYLLLTMEAFMTSQHYRTLYTIARSISYGMNITFSKLGYTYSGTLINNTHIGGSIESMNVWYKKI